MKHDVLDGLLPSGNPLAPFDPAANPLPQSWSIPTEPEAFAREPEPATQAPITRPSEPAPPAMDVALLGAVIEPLRPVAAESRIGRRHRSAVPAGALMGLLVLGLFAAIIGALWLLMNGLGVTPDGQLVAVDSRNSGRPVIAEEAAPSRPARTDNRRVTREPMHATPPPLPDEPAEPETDAEATIVATESPTGEADNAIAADGATADADDATGDTEDAMGDAEDAPAEADDAVQDADDAVQGGEEAIQRAEEAIRGGEWEQMSLAVQQAESAARTPDQRRRSADLALLVELADYYREGIRRGAGGLGAAESFELVPNMRVIVVESDEEKIILKINGRNRKFDLEALPLVLAHRLSTFALPAEEPMAEAARAAYQMLWPQATDAHRQQALKWLRETPATDEADYASLVPTASDLFEIPEPHALQE